MSFLFGGRPQLSSAEKIAAAETEIEMVSDMFNRLTQSCAKKCIPPDYRESDLNKGESVCLDRCVSKFFEVNMKVSEKMQNEAAGKQGISGGMGYGM
ncbi:protein transporter tim10 [Xylographa bjoerkii]|nr:protein transporter tim10 [Xylographa bjoerkii]